MEPGKLGSRYPVRFDGDRGGNSQFGSYAVQAWLCKSCGHIQLRADEKFKELAAIDAMPNPEEREKVESQKVAEAKKEQRNQNWRMVGCLVIILGAMVLFMIINLISS